LPSTTPVETAVGQSTSTVLPYPLATSNPTIDTPYPVPNSTLPSTPVSTFIPPPSPSPIPPNIISKVQLICTPQSDFAKCTDHTLKVEFEYPAIWGNIEAVLRTGDTGYAYSYTFDALSVEQASVILAGGRSKDFSEGRGGMITDFKGFGDNSSQTRCASVREFIPICHEIKLNVVLLLDFPEARSICDPVPGTLYSPIAILDINLPTNPVINGFRFVSPFLSGHSLEKLNADLRETLGYALETGPTSCDDSSRAEFDRRINDLIEKIMAGTVDQGTSDNIATIEHIAQSIIFQ
jgi:hypothetical protein